MTFVPLVVVAEDLELHIGTALDEQRALHFLDLAVAEVQTIVDPVPNACKGIVLDAAARAYTTPVPRQSETVGPYTLSGTQGGVTLTRRERQTARRCAGGGSAFSISMIGDDDGSGLPAWDYTDTGDITPDDAA